MWNQPIVLAKTVNFICGVRSIWVFRAAIRKCFDESIANQDRIEQILRDIHEQDAQRASERMTGSHDEHQGDSEHGSPPSASSESPEGLEGRIPDPGSRHNDDGDRS